MKTSDGAVAAAVSMNQPDGVVTGARSPKAPAVIIESAAMAMFAEVVFIRLTLACRANCRCSVVNTREVPARCAERSASPRALTTERESRCFRA